MIDPALRYGTYDKRTTVAARATATRAERVHYNTMSDEEIKALPVPDLLKKNSAALLWTSGTFLRRVIDILENGWGLRYIGVAFVWIKANPNVAPIKTQFGMGHWTRANAEFVVMATKGKPKRLNADIRQVIVEPEGIIEPSRNTVASPTFPNISSGYSPGRMRTSRAGKLAMGGTPGAIKSTFDEPDALRPQDATPDLFSRQQKKAWNDDDETDYPLDSGICRASRRPLARINFFQTDGTKEENRNG